MLNLAGRFLHLHLVLWGIGSCVDVVSQTVEFGGLDQSGYYQNRRQRSQGGVFLIQVALNTYRWKRLTL